jgi:signal transduction histidine kinase
VPSDLLQDVARLGALVDDLLVLARLDATERPDAVAEPFDLRSLAVGLTQGYAGARVPVTVAPGAPVLVRAAADEVRRVVTNLVDNAVRHASTRVLLTCSVEGQHGALSVTDDGPGIPAGQRERVFARFVRLDDARSREAGGTGLGLAIARELARRSGGEVTHDAPPAGSAVGRAEESSAGPVEESAAGLVATVRLPR